MPHYSGVVLRGQPFFHLSQKKCLKSESGGGGVAGRFERNIFQPLHRASILFNN
jgi:hypothetical protein